MASTATAARHQSKKLLGRAFYESLGSPKYILAPMVDHSDAVSMLPSSIILIAESPRKAWRILTRSFLPDSPRNLIAYSPMLHSRLFSNTPKYRAQNFEPLHVPLTPPTEENSARSDCYDTYLDGHPKFDRPLIVQFCSNSPHDLLAAARYVEPFCDAVDLNLGCPQGIAKKGKYGSYLQEDWDLIFKLINELHTHLSIPVTAKIRILETRERTLEYAKMILAAGASIITVHGRQRFQKGHYTGLADWSVLRYLRDNLPPDTVIFANGNVLQHNDIARCLEATGADGIMSAEGALADPTIFAQPPPPGREGREYWRGRDGRGGFRVDAVLRRYIDIIYRYVLECEPPKREPLFHLSDGDSFGPPQELTASEKIRLSTNVASYRQKQQDVVSVNIRVMQSHLFHMLRPLVAKHTKIRDALARCRAGDIAAFEDVLHQVECVVAQGILDHEAASDQPPTIECLGTSTEDYDFEIATRSSEAAVQRCRRPWFICQSHVRPLPQEAILKGAITLSKKQKKVLHEEKFDNQPAEMAFGRSHKEVVTF